MYNENVNRQTVQYMRKFINRQKGARNIKNKVLYCRKIKIINTLGGI